MGRNSGLSSAVTDPVSPVADFDAHRLGCVDVARMFQKTGWSERWCTRIVHAARTLGRIAMPGSHRQSEVEGAIEGCWSGACCPFVETENEIHVEEWCEPAWLGARRLMAQSGCRDTDGMGELECDATSAYGKGGGSQKTGNQRDVSDRIGAQITLVEKKENRTAPRANRVEVALSSNLEKAESAEARKTLDQDQVECGVGEGPQENAKQAFQLELDSKTQKPRICCYKLLPRLLLDSGRSGGDNPIRETTLGRAVEELENRLCRREC